MNEWTAMVLCRIGRQLSSYLTVNDRFGDVELSNHAKWDGTSAWLGVIKLTLEENGVDVLLLGEDLSSTSSRRSSSNNGNLVPHVQSRSGWGSIPDRGSSHESRGSESTCGGKAGNSNGELHFR